jgi:hypothetical protein
MLSSEPTIPSNPERPTIFIVFDILLWIRHIHTQTVRHLGWFHATKYCCNSQYEAFCEANLTRRPTERENVSEAGHAEQLLWEFFWLSVQWKSRHEEERVPTIWKVKLQHEIFSLWAVKRAAVFLFPATKATLVGGPLGSEWRLFTYRRAHRCPRIPCNRRLWPPWPFAGLPITTAWTLTVNWVGVCRVLSFRILERIGGVFICY